MTEWKQRNCNEEFKKKLRLLISRINLHTSCNSPGQTVSTDHTELVLKYKQGAFSWRSLGHLGRERRIPLPTFLPCSKTPCGSSCHCWGQWCLQTTGFFSSMPETASMHGRVRKESLLFQPHQRKEHMDTLQRSLFFLCSYVSWLNTSRWSSKSLRLEMPDLAVMHLLW